MGFMFWQQLWRIFCLGTPYVAPFIPCFCGFLKSFNEIFNYWNGQDLVLAGSFWFSNATRGRTLLSNTFARSGNLLRRPLRRCARAMGQHTHIAQTKMTFFARVQCIFRRFTNGRIGAIASAQEFVQRNSLQRNKMLLKFSSLPKIGLFFTISTNIRLRTMLFFHRQQK